MWSICEIILSLKKCLYIHSPGSRGSSLSRDTRASLLSLLLLQLLQGVGKVFLGQLSDIVTPACPGSSSGLPPRGACMEYLPGGASDTKMPKPPQSPPLNVEELNYNLLLGDKAPLPLSEHPAIQRRSLTSAACI